MGFFSWQCKKCSKSILNLHGVMPGDKNAWMGKAVAITSNGSMLRGHYDGYGRLDGAEIPRSKEPDLYHASCHVLAGEPTQYSGGSEFAQDQGWFYDDADYDLPDPLLS